MSNPVANVNILTDNWESLVIRLNRLAQIVSTEVVTANSTYANTGNSSYSVVSQLFGTFGANNLVVTNGIKGGNVNGNTADLVVGSNLQIATSGVVKIGNTTANVVINSTSFGLANSTVTLTITGNKIAPSANLLIDGTTQVNGVFSTTGNSSIGGPQQDLANTFVTIVTTNNNIGANISAPQLITRFPKATYNTGKILAQITNSGNAQISEMVIAHDGTTAELSVYGTVASPAGANAASNPLGTFSANVNGANVDILLTQTIANSAVKIVANLIK